MKKDFYAPARYKMAIPLGLAGVAGGLIFPAGIPAPVLVRRDLSKNYPHLARRLFDPQLYLAALPSVTCRKACVNLASYGWFVTDGVKAYDSGKQDQSAWKQEAMAKIHHSWKHALPQSDSAVSAAVLKCVAFQNILGCEHIILPSPLTTDLASSYSSELNWLDVGLKAAVNHAPGKKRLATIALSDTCLRGLDPWKNELLTVIVDQVTARMPEGAYIVIEQSNEHGYYCTHPNTAGSLLRLAFQLKQGGLQRVVVGLTGIAGFLAVAAGADAWSAGWYRGERRIRLTDFEDQMGMAVPTYYTHSLAGEIHLEEDVDRLNKRGLLKGMEDRTRASEGLLQALRSGGSAASVPEWKYRRSNVAAASEHFVAAAVRETDRLSGMSKEACLQHTHEWLTKAEQLASGLYSVGGLNSRTELNHQAAWLQAFERFLDVTGAS